MLKIAEISDKVHELEQETQAIFQKEGYSFPIIEKDQERIVIVFAGQYSAGKSSIVKMLTNIDDIEIGAGVTTQFTHEYDWNGLTIVDTPGIHTEKNPDHDARTYDAINKADLLVFVVTNELFDSHMAEHFRKLAIEKDKADEMVLVVNKMSRATEGNTKEQQDVLINNLKEVLLPKTPDTVPIVFTDANLYFDSLKEKGEFPEMANEDFKESGYTELVNTIDEFVKEKGQYGKMTNSLYVIDDLLEAKIEELQPESEDLTIDALEDNYLRQRHILSETRINIGQELNSIFGEAAAKIRDLGLNAANAIQEGCKREEVEHTLQQYAIEAETITSNCENKALELVQEKMKEIDHIIDSFENDEFSSKLKIQIDGQFESLPENIKEILLKSSSGLKKAGQSVMDSAYKSGSTGGLKLTNFSGSTIHEWVLKIGHGVGYKFKPWEAIKVTKGIAIGGQVLSVFGVVINVAMQIKTDKDEDNIRSAMKSNRDNIRSVFYSNANDFENYGHSFTRQNVYDPIDKSIEELDNNIKQIRKTRKQKSTICIKLEQLHNKCTDLIKRIHREVSIGS